MISLSDYLWLLVLFHYVSDGVTCYDTVCHRPYPAIDTSRFTYFINAQLLISYGACATFQQLSNIGPGVKHVFHVTKCVWFQCWAYLDPERKREVGRKPSFITHDDVIKLKHFPGCWPFMWGNHRPPVNSPHKKPVTGSFDIFFGLRLFKRLSKRSKRRCFWRHCNHYDVTVMKVDRITTTNFNLNIEMTQGYP